MRRAALFLVVVFTFAPAATAIVEPACQSTDGYWKDANTDSRLKSVLTTLTSLMACQANATPVELTTLNDASACNWFLSKSLDKLYGVKDFVPAKDSEWLSANAIADYVASSPSWSELGRANVQSVLQDAANGAQNGQPVIAVWKNPGGHGHVALVLPGPLKASTTWKLNVPNSASFFLDEKKAVKKAYVGCRLSAAFGDEKITDVRLYWRLKAR